MTDAQSNVVSPARWSARWLGDSLKNLVTGLGTTSDKNVYTTYVMNFLTKADVENAFRGDWFARKILKIPTDDSTREWRSWQASKAQIEAIEAVERRHCVQQKVAEAMLKDRIYGGSGIVMGIGTADAMEPLDATKVRKDELRYLHVLSRYELLAGEIELNPELPNFGRPKYYEMQVKGRVPVRVHWTRVLRFVEHDVPDRELAVGRGWGDSALQPIDDAIKNIGLSGGGIATLLNEAKNDVIQIPNFMAQVGTSEYRDRLLERVSLANRTKSLINAVILDKEETWNRIQTSFTGLPDIYKLYLLVGCAAGDVPATRALGQSAVGMNATGDGDLRNYYDRLGSDQKNRVTPTIAPLDEVIIWSALGSRPKEVFYNWRPMWQMDEAQKADVGVKKATIFKTDVDAGLMDPEVLGEARMNQLIEDGTYPGLEIIEVDVIEEPEKDLDEDDPEVKTQFGESGTGGPDVQKEALNGTQISSLLEIVTLVGSKDIPPETAKAVIGVSFPTLSSTEINQLVDPMIEHEPPASKVPVIPPGLNGQRPPPGDPMLEPPRAAPPLAEDARPRSLYVRRDLKNASALIKWAKEQGFSDTEAASEMHVTLCYSRGAVDWIKAGEGMAYSGDENGVLRVPPGGPRIVEPLGDDGAVVLLFASSALSWRHEDLKRAGATHDYEHYQPHVTIAYSGAPPNLDKIVPYRGELVFGPEIFEELK